MRVHRVAAAVLLSSLMVCAAPRAGGAQGEAPAEFSFRSLDGGNVTSADLRGKVVVLIFGDARLRVTKEQAESVRLLEFEFAPRGVVFYLVSTDPETPGSKNYASDEEVREHLRKRGLRLPILRDPGGKTLRKYGRGQIPLVVVLDGEGRVEGKPLEGFGPRGSFLLNMRPRLARLTDGRSVKGK
ncbi:MAG: redoxin domain-containing protein [Pyrinomonadaceae bacterium]